MASVDRELDGERLASLYRVTSGLGAARTPAQVADVIVTAGSPILGGCSGSLCVLLADGETFELVRSEGYSTSVEEEFARFPLAAPLPAGDAIRDRAPVFLESLLDRDLRYPVLVGHPANSQSFAILPLIAEGRPLGVFTIGFEAERRFDAEDVAFLMNLADQCAQALGRTQAFAAAEALADRLAFLAEASGSLGESLDPDETMRRLCELLAPAVADRCVILPGDALVRIVGQDVGGPRPTLLPLVARGHVLGVVSLSNDADRRLTTEDIDLARQLTTRAAIAIDNARLHAAVSDVARTLQRALLPPALPVIPGLDLAARYLPASQTLEVGGDFYDAFPTSPERWVLAVGDVCGRGIEAATVTGAARHAIRSAATRTSSPAEILATLDEVLCEEAPDRFCTTAVAVVDRTTHGITVTVASAGHPAPLLRRGGVVAEVELAGALLGVAGLDLDRARREVVLELEPGDALLLYTDGFTEARRGTDFFDGGGLADAVLAAGPDAGAEAVVEAVVRAVQRHVGGDIDDDAAALAAVVTG